MTTPSSAVQVLAHRRHGLLPEGSEATLDASPTPGTLFNCYQNPFMPSLRRSKR